MITIPAQKKYTGRLAFDPDSGFHLAEDGKQVVTEDGGQTWRYATDSDSSHLDRYQQRVAVIDTTANADNPEPHHIEVQPDDPHFGGVRSNPEAVAATVTGHTDAYKEPA